MSNRASVPVSPAPLLELLSYLSLHQRSDELPQIVDQALQQWLEQARADGHRQRPHTVHGYQWKQLFLPEGTRLRTWDRAVYHYATVVGDDIVFDGHCVSPNQFVSGTGMTRNAWRDIALLFPGDKHWLPARHHRQALPTAVRLAFDKAPAARVPRSCHRWNGNERRQSERRTGPATG
jgi:hypothetical protein